MPTFRNLTEDERDAALDAFDAQLLSIMEGQRKLRERLEAVKLDSDEAAEIKIAFIRLDLKADGIMRKKEDFEDDTLALQPPTPAMLDKMTERVGAIREINVRNEMARGILKAIVAVAGQLPKAPGVG
jgi:hypothetical protein